MFFIKKRSNNLTRKKSDFSFKKLKYGLKIFLISNKLKKSKNIEEWFEKRNKYLLNLKLEKFIKFEGNLDKNANIYFLNHQSFIEILFIPYIIKEKHIIGVVKHELQKSTFSKGFTKFDIGINRNDPRSSIKMIKKIRQYLKENTKIVIYPEGTRNRTNKPLLAFKENLGKLLSRENIKVQGIVIKDLKEFIKGKSKNITVKYLNTYNTNDKDWYQKIYNEMYKELSN